MYYVSVIEINHKTYCNWRTGMVFIMVIGTENNKFSHTHNIVNFIPPAGGRPLKCLPIAHQIF